MLVFDGSQLFRKDSSPSLQGLVVAKVLVKMPCLVSHSK